MRWARLLRDAGLALLGLALAYAGWANGYGAAICRGQEPSGAPIGCRHDLDHAWLGLGLLGVGLLMAGLARLALGLRPRRAA